MHALLEDYLSEVAAHLGPMPAKQRRDELREMRAHLEAAAAGRREWGQSEDTAVRNALVQFGTPDALGQSAVAAWQRGVRRDWRDLASAAACTFALMLATHLIMLWCSAVHFSAFDFRVALWGGGMGAAVGLCGLCFPRRAVLAVQIGLVLFFAAFFGVFHLGLGDITGSCMDGLVGTWLTVQLKSQTMRKRQVLR